MQTLQPRWRRRARTRKEGQAERQRERAQVRVALFAVTRGRREGRMVMDAMEEGTEGEGVAAVVWRRRKKREKRLEREKRVVLYVEGDSEGEMGWKGCSLAPGPL